MRELTRKQERFVTNFVTNGGNGADAARKAGFSARTAREHAYALLHIPHVRAAIRAEQERVLRCNLATRALGVLEAIMPDEIAPAGARVDAAKTLLDRAGLPALPHNAARDVIEFDGRALVEMTADELQQVILKSRAMQAKLAAGETIDVGPEPAAERLLSSSTERTAADA